MAQMMLIDMRWRSCNWRALTHQRACCFAVVLKRVGLESPSTLKYSVHLTNARKCHQGDEPERLLLLGKS